MKYFLGWNLSRLLFMVIGISLVIQSIIKFEWVGIILGAYFLVMGIFKLGCAKVGCQNSKNQK